MKTSLIIISILYLLLFCSCSETSLNEETDIGNSRINLNGRIENIVIGMDSISVINELGEPDYYGYAEIQINNIILGYNTDEDGALEITLFEDFVVDSSFAVMGVRVRREYLGSAQNGLGIGSTKQEVLRLLNTETSYYVPEGLCNFNTVFLFSYDDKDKVDQISMDYYK